LGSALFGLLESTRSRNANLMSELQENITSLEEATNEASWTEWSHGDEIRRLEGIVDRKNISSIGRDPAIICFAKRIAVYLVRSTDYKLRSTICGPAVQEWKARWNILHPRNRHLVLVVCGRQRGGATTRTTTICHFF
jgi:hypothetical protein